MCGVRSKNSCLGCESSYKEDMAGVQWYEVLDNESLTLDKIEKDLHLGELR